jgi:hypothetical protein
MLTALYDIITSHNFSHCFSVPAVPMGIYISPSIRLANTGMCLVVMLHKTDAVVHVMQVFNPNM